MITSKTRESVFVRAGGKCENKYCQRNLVIDGAWECHHVFFKSGYFKNDRDQAWNLVCLCPDCHRISRKNKDNKVCWLGIHQGNEELRKEFEKLAEKRKFEIK